MVAGMKSQLLMVARPEPLLKLAAMYEVAAPLLAAKTPALPWNQPVTPSGLLRFCEAQPAGSGAATSNPWLKTVVGTGGSKAWLSTEGPIGIQAGGGVQVRPVTVRV